MDWGNPWAGFGLDLWGIVAVLLILLPNAVWMALPPREFPQTLRPAHQAFTILEWVGRILCLLLPICFGSRIGQQMSNPIVWGMAACVAMYDLGWVRYFTGGRKFGDLFRPLWGIPLPMAVFPLAYFFLLGFLTHSVPILFSALLFAVGHLVFSWNTWRQIR